MTDGEVRLASEIGKGEDGFRGDVSPHGGADFTQSDFDDRGLALDFQKDRAVGLILDEASDEVATADGSNGGSKPHALDPSQEAHTLTHEGERIGQFHGARTGKREEGPL